MDHRAWCMIHGGRYSAVLHDLRSVRADLGVEPVHALAAVFQLQDPARDLHPDDGVSTQPVAAEVDEKTVAAIADAAACQIAAVFVRAKAFDQLVVRV